MVKRKIIHIDEEKCNGCGECIPNCAEGAIKIVDGKARLISDKYCDGLGACLGHCPQGALKIIEREAEEFDEQAVEELLAQKKASETGKDLVITSPATGCPGSRSRIIKKEKTAVARAAQVDAGDVELSIKSQLSHWPVQLALVPASGELWQDADVLISASCVPVAYPNYHLGLLKGKKVVIGCPKLDNLGMYLNKLTNIFANNNINSITVAYMEVPCCGGIVSAVERALQAAGKDVPVNKIKIGIDGEVLDC